MTAVRMDLPPDGQYARWEIDLAVRYPLALSEMRWPSAPLGTMGARALARWGIECKRGWRSVVVALLDRLEREIEAQPLDERDAYRIVQIKEKFGRLTVYLASGATPAMWDAIDDAGEQSIKVCEFCGESGVLAERRFFWSVRCRAHEDWLPWDGNRT